MATNEYTSKFSIDITDLKKGMQEANKLMQVANSEFKAATGGMDKWGNSADGLSAKLQQLNKIHDLQKAKLELLENEYNKVVAAEGENSKGAQDLYIKMNNLKGEIGKTESQIKTYSTRLNEMKNAEKQAAATAQETMSTYDQLKQTISEQESELQRLKQEYANVSLEQGQNSDEAKHLASEIQSLSGELKENKSKLKEADDAADDFDKTLDDLGDSAEDSAGGFTIMKGALAELVADGIKKAAEALKDLLTASSEANANFQAQTGTSAKEMEKFSDSIKEVYKQNFGESMQDVADAMAEVKKQTNEIDPSKLEEMTKSGITLRDTFGYELNESMRAVNMLMNQFGLTSEQAFNFIVEGAQSGLDKNGDLLDTINEYAVHYKQQGYSADEFYNSLKNGAASGTFSIDKLGDAMKEFGIRSKDTATTTTEGFELIGLNADEMRDKFAKGGESAQEATKQTLEALFDMDDQVKQNQAGVDLFGTMWEDLGKEGVQALMDVSGQAVTTKKSMEELQNVKYSDLGSQIGSIGRLFKEELFQPLVDLILPAVQAVAQYIIDNFDTIGPIILGVAAAFTVLAGALAIQALINGVTKAFALLNLTMLANPYVLAAAAIAGLVVAFVALWQKSEGFRDFWTGLWDGIKEVTGTVVDAIVNFFTVTIPEAFTSVITAIGDFVTSAVEWFQQLPEKVGEFIGSVIDWFAQLPEKIGEFLGNVITSVIEWGSNMIDKAVEVGSSFLTSVVTFFQKLPYKIGYFIGYVLGTIIKWVADMIAKAKEVGSKFLDAVVTFFKELPGKVHDFVSNTLKKVAEWAVNMKDKAIETGKNFLSFIVNFFKQLPGKIWDFLTNAISKVISWASSMGAKAKEAGSTFLSNVVSFVKQLPGKVWEFLSNVISKLVTWASDMGKKGKEGAKSMFDAVVTGLKELPEKVLSIGSDIVHGIWNGISGAAGWLADKVKSFASGIVDGMMKALKSHSPSRVFRDKVGKTIPWGVGVGIEKNTDLALDPMKNLASGLVSSVSGIKGKISTATTKATNGGSQSGTAGGVVQNFYQYNNSPKALSRLEIYRQTKNQLTFAKGV